MNDKLKMKEMLLASVLVCLCLSSHVLGSCDTGERNQTITVSCSETVSVDVKYSKTVTISPDCNFLEEGWSWFKSKFGSNDRCSTKYWTQYYTKSENREVPSFCESVICCPGYVNSTDGFCEIGCSNGTYGVNCTENCTCPDNAYSQCDKVTGNCTCQAGRTGVNCTEPCDEGYYGDDCQRECACQNNATCDIVSGDCNCTEPGWTGPYCDQKCNGTFELNCSQKCTCNENQTCDTADGNCTCKPGQTGLNCSDECEDGQFEIDCAYNCSCNEDTTDHCDKVTGNCQCKPGFIGQNCSDICPIGFYGIYCSENCTCVGTPHCDHRNGTCICLGKHGENCSEDCNKLHYGIDCESICNCSGDNYNDSCDPITGTCHCKPGWEGNACSTEKGSRNGQTDAQERNGDENNIMTTDLMIGLIAGGCGLLIIIIIIIVLVVQRRRKQKCFKRADVKGYNNATYSKAQETVVLNEAEQQHGGKAKGEVPNKIVRENGSFKSQDGAVDATTTSTDTERKSREQVPDLDKENTLGELKKPISNKYEHAIEDSENQPNDGTHSGQMFYEITEKDDTIDLTQVNEDGDSAHYSDVDSLKDETVQRSYSLVEVDNRDAVTDLLDDQEHSDEERYDSLENTVNKNVKKLPNYSSFELVRKESVDRDSETTEDPYDKVILTSPTKKKTVTRKDYNAFNIVNKTVDGEPNEVVHHNQNNFVKKKNSIPVSAQNKELESIHINDDNTEYNTLDHTGKSFISKAPENIYHTKEILSIKESKKTNLSVNANVDKNDAKVESSCEIKSDAENFEAEDPEYNILDHTGKSFRAVHTPDNIYHTKDMLSKKDTDKSNVTPDEDGSKTEANATSPLGRTSDLNNETVVEDSEYNTLDHTGKSFRVMNIPDNIYHNKGSLSKTENKNFIPVDIGDPQTDKEEDNSYSFCEIDNVNTGDGEKVIADDDKYLYEVPDISDDDLKTNVACVSKVKPKAKQRNIDDYEPFDLTFGSSAPS